MLYRIARLLLVAVLVSSGASAPFLHVHAHGSEHGASSSHGAGVDEHCAHHHAEGAHWHPAGSRAADTGGVLATGAAPHRHSAVTLSSAAVETSTVGAGASFALVDAPESGIQAGPDGMRAPVAADAGPDPPPLIRLATRAPPFRS